MFFASNLVEGLIVMEKSRTESPLAVGIKPPLFVRVSMLIAILSLVAQFHHISVFSRTNTNPALRSERETGWMCVTCIETGRNCICRNFVIKTSSGVVNVATSQIKRWPYGICHLGEQTFGVGLRTFCLSG